jgi:hypothetical protein
LCPSMCPFGGAVIASSIFCIGVIFICLGHSQTALWPTCWTWTLQLSAWWRPAMSELPVHGMTTQFDQEIPDARTAFRKQAVRQHFTC